MSRVLLLGPSFFGYRDLVGRGLSRLGHEVEVADDRPSESVAFRSLAKVSYAPLAPAIERHARRLERRLREGRHDLVVYLGGMTFCLSPAQLARLRAATGASFAAYLWDSLANSPRVDACLGLFDRVLSFDPADCAARGLELRPLFFSGPFREVPLAPAGGFEYDACFVGSVHQPSKFEAVLGIIEALEAQGLRVLSHLYMPSRSAEALRRATRPSYRRAALTRTPLTAREVARAYAASRAVIDSPQPGQSGLTMRTLEAVGARRKLITANPEALRYDLAGSGQVMAWDGGAGAAGFVSSPFRELPADVYESYSAEAFCRALAGGGEPFGGYSPGA